MTTLLREVLDGRDGSSELQLKEGWSTVFLFIVMSLCVAWSFQAAQMTEGLSILQGVVLVGSIMGVVLAKSRTPARMAHVLAALAGLTWGLWLTSQFIAASTGLSGQEAVHELDLRLRGWVYDLVTTRTSSGSTAYVVLLSLLLWIMTYTAAWSIFRWQRVWWAVIVCAVPLMVNVTSTGRNLTLLLLAFLVVALLLVVRGNLAGYEQRWRLERVQYNAELVSGFLRAGLAVSVLTIGLAWLAPEALASGSLRGAWEKVSKPWQRFQDRWDDMFKDLDYQQEPQIIVRSRVMRFGGPVNLTDRPIMDIEAPAGRYWRSRVYQVYTGLGWLNDDMDQVDLEANDPRLSEQPDLDGRVTVTQTVTLREGITTARTLTAAGQPLRVSVPVEAITRLPVPAPQPTPAVEGLPVGTGGPSLLYPQDTLRPGLAYQVVSSVASASAAQLRAAGTDYPAWVIARYLALPETIPDRIRALAEELTDGLEAPYDKVLALEAYLRGFAYNEQIQGAGVDQDGVDYFLFDAKQGYCSYYASAMVVMLRMVSVPARYVEGYSQSERVSGVYHVLEKDGHAWPEVYFPGFGWVEFEPTASKTLNTWSREESEDPRDDAGRDDIFANRMRDRPMDDLELPPEAERPAVPFLRRISVWVWVILGSVVVGAWAVVLLALRRRRRWAGLSVVERVFSEMSSWSGRLLRLNPLPHQTPHEYASAVGNAVPRAHALVHSITDAYVEERFGARPTAGEATEAAWREIRPLLWQRWGQAKAEPVIRLWRRWFTAEG